MLLTRILTAAVMLVLFLAALLLLPASLWLACLAPVLALGAREWARLAGLGPRPGWGYASVVTAAGLALALMPLDPAPVFYVAAVVFWVFAVPLWLRRGWSIRGAGLLAVGVLVLVPTWLALLELQRLPAVLLAFLAVVWIADTAAYLAGRRWGRRKLAPAISPGKTWEGVAGAAVAVAVYYVLLQFLFPDPPGALSGATGAAAFAALLFLSVEGDLFESWLKRCAGVKDSGTLLPGHGGVLDRIDGLTATLPAVALLVRYNG